MIGFFDITKNEHPKLIIENLPTIQLYKPNSPMELFNNEISEENLVQFLNENSELDLKVKFKASEL